MQEIQRGTQKTQIGFVVSSVMEKTVVVQVTRRYKHRQFKKYVSKRTKYKAHDERNECNVGDKVLLIETRPLSREKRWRVKEILFKAV